MGHAKRDILLCLTCTILFLSTLTCGDDGSLMRGDPELEEGWTDLDFENKLPIRMKMADDCVYVCAGPDGLWRRNVRDSASEWECLGLSDPTFDAFYHGVEDVDVVGDDILVAYNSKNIASDPGIWRSCDGGISWTRSDSGVPSAEFPYSYMVGISRSPHNQNIGIAFNGSLFRTIDGGDTWTLMDKERGNLADLTYPIWNPDSPGEVWLFGSGSMFQPILTKSADWGLTWEGFPAIWSPTMPIENHVLDVAFDAVDPNVVYVGLLGIAIVTEDGGTTWEIILDAEFDRPFSCIVAHPDIGDLVYIAAGELLYSSDDRGETTEIVEVPFNSVIRSMCYHAATQSLIVGTDSGVFRYVTLSPKTGSSIPVKIS